MRRVAVKVKKFSEFINKEDTEGVELILQVAGVMLVMGLAIGLTIGLSIAFGVS